MTDVEAMIAASGHTEADSTLILAELRKIGWTLQPASATEAAYLRGMDAAIKVARGS